MLYLHLSHDDAARRMVLRSSSFGHQVVVQNTFLGAYLDDLSLSEPRAASCPALSSLGSHENLSACPHRDSKHRSEYYSETLGIDMGLPLEFVSAGPRDDRRGQFTYDAEPLDVKLDHTVLLGREQGAPGSIGGLLQTHTCTILGAPMPGTTTQQSSLASSAVSPDFLQPIHVLQKSSEAGAMSPLEQLRRSGEKLLSQTGLNVLSQTPVSLALPPGIVLRKSDATSTSHRVGGSRALSTASADVVTKRC
eukprot:TRINITY_DN75427_c0_g1_i1.p1 TRINITY_DN75427_c0_g1~~TRINITY_DN75427_c0_g1_i1.p1  ORF type:complete len:250 (-),score=32.01 TRINITY_DN75427_c0_g1_i1:195-944(-)